MRNHRKQSSSSIKKIRLNVKVVVGTILLALGVFLLTIPKLAPVNTAATQPIRPDTAFSITSVGKPPVRILIPSVAIDLPIKIAHIVNGYWELSEDSASFGEGSSPPGSTGNTVVFAHAREGLFLPLKDLKVHAHIYIMTNDQWFTYDVTEIKEVWPNDTYVISPTKSKQITLFTCSGFFDNKRLVVIGKPI